VPVPKSALMIAIGKMRPGAKESPGDEPDAYQEGLDATAEEILSAVKSDNAKALSAALLDFCRQADAMPHSEGGEEG